MVSFDSVHVYTYTAHGKLYAFSCIPLGEGAKSHDIHETGCILRLSGGRGRVVSITDRSEGNVQQVYVVRGRHMKILVLHCKVCRYLQVQDSGELSVLQYDCRKYKWGVKGEIHL